MNKIGEEWHRSVEKRNMDLKLGSALLPMAILGSLATAAVVALEGEMPVFTQDRRHGGRIIRIQKIKTYKGEVTSMSRAKARSQGVEMNRHGAFIRKIKADELLQVIPVIRGYMSIVGVRPIVPSELEEVMDVLSAEEQRDYLHACDITKPGLVHPGARRMVEGSSPDPRERAAYTIDYAHNGTRKTDLESLGKLFSHVATGAIDRIERAA